MRKGDWNDHDRGVYESNRATLTVPSQKLPLLAAHAEGGVQLGSSRTQARASAKPQTTSTSTSVLGVTFRCALTAAVDHPFLG